MNDLAKVHVKADIDAVGAALRAMYLPWLEESARRLQEAVKAAGGLSSIQTDLITSGICTVFVDGLRYDVAVQLQERLSAFGDAQLSARWTSLPSVTASGKAWYSPVAQLIGGSADDVDLEPRVLADGKSLSGHSHGTPRHNVPNGLTSETAKIIGSCHNSNC